MQLADRSVTLAESTAHKTSGVSPVISVGLPVEVERPGWSAYKQCNLIVNLKETFKRMA
jgi:hypothetical protein